VRSRARGADFSHKGDSEHRAIPGPEEPMMSRAAIAVVAAVLFVAAGGCTVLTVAQGTVPTDAQRRECERNGGYWATSSGYCKIGA
jgi:hypothetical protein